ncbi:MAG: MFS transporter [Thermoproteus sp. AZ2]|uniref:MFS transporter n=1 Tax=Thermoproteus sp. AZ2 TaxID=1609232 RepID=A0ACC6UZ64_9CREN
MAKAGVAAAVLAPFLMSAASVFSITFKLREVASALGASTLEVALAITLSFIGGAIGGVALGALADAYGRRLGLFTSILVFSAAEALAGFAKSIWLLYAAWLSVGFGVNAENGIAYAVIAETWRGGRPGLIGGLTQGLYFIGMFLDAALSFLPWRLLLVLIGVASAATAPLALLVPEGAGRRGKAPPLAEIFRGGLLAVTALASALVAAAFMYTIPLATLAPDYLEEIGAEALWRLALPLLGFAAFALAGWLSDIFGGGRVVMALAPIGLASALALPLAGALSAPDLAAAYFASSYFAYLGVWISELYPAEVRATATNFVFTLGRVMGGVGPALVAAAGLPWGLSLDLAACSLAALISAALLSRR